MITVADILEKKGTEVWLVGQDSVIRDAVELMFMKNIGAVPVIGPDKKPVGILSERDVARALLTEKGNLLEKPVSALMNPRVQCIPGTLSMMEVMFIMTKNRSRHLPVCDKGTLAGLISIGDVVKNEIHEQEIVIDQLEHYISGSL